ncbi:MAG: response regulator [Deinococcota bacterium]
MSNILVIDDAVTIQRLMQAVLASEGHIVRSEDSGTSGLQEIKHHPPDLLILDVGLPDISGFDVAQTLRNDPSLHDLPILIITGLDNTDNLVKSLDVADDYLAKPFAKRELIARVNALLRRRQRNDHLKGRLELVGGVAELIQTIAKHGSGGLVLEEDGTTIYFADGLVVHATSQDASGMDAIRNVFQREEGAFHFDPGLRAQLTTLAHDPTALLLEAASHYDEMSRREAVTTFSPRPVQVATKTNEPSSESDVSQLGATSSQDNATNSKSTGRKRKRKPRRVDISNLTLSSLAVVDKLAEAFTYIRGLRGRYEFLVSEHVDPETNAPYLLFDSGDIKIVSQNSSLEAISDELATELRLELLLEDS